MSNHNLHTQPGSSTGQAQSMDGRVEDLRPRLARLRPIIPADYQFLYELTISEDIGYRWRYYGPFPTYESFVQSFQRNDNPQFVVVQSAQTESGQRGYAGWVMSYKFDPANGTAYIGVIIAQPFIGSGIGIEAAGLFLDYLFRYWNLRKIYSEAPEYTFRSYRSGLGKVFREEGVLLGHRYYDGRFWDEHIIAVYREDWKKLALIVPWLSKDDAAGAPAHPGQWWVTTATHDDS
jgi:RimJ/RimL family protein N-acetyltransferase